MPPSKVRGIRVDYASNHSYLESRSRSSWTASAILKCRLCIGFSHLRWWIRQFRGRHQKKVITFSLLSSFPQKMAWYRYLKAKENPFELTKTSKHRTQHVHWFHCTGKNVKNPIQFLLGFRLDISWFSRKNQVWRKCNFPKFGLSRNIRWGLRQIPSLAHLYSQDWKKIQERINKKYNFG